MKARQQPSKRFPGTALMEERYFCLYPVDIDSTKTTAGGRKYRRELCVSRPRYQEIKNAIDFLGLEHISEPTKKHPRDFFSAGRFRIKKIYGKKFAIEGIAHTIAGMRDKTIAHEAEKAKAKAPVEGGVMHKGRLIENKLNLVPRKKNKGKKNK
jgi:signal recognition particle subunit SRP19